MQDIKNSFLRSFLFLILYFDWGVSCSSIVDFFAPHECLILNL